MNRLLYSKKIAPNFPQKRGPWGIASRMKRFSFSVFLLIGALAPLKAQPSFSGEMPSLTVVEDATERRKAYLARLDEIIDWVAGDTKYRTEDPADFNIAEVIARLLRREDLDGCSRRVIELMGKPSSGPFWMFPTVCLAYTGRDLLSPEARASIREAWRTTRQLRGDTENHFVMYYVSLYLMSELYPDDAGDQWYNGRSSAENRAEAKAFLTQWMDLATTVGQGEFNPTHYIGEYLIPMVFLKAWARDPEMQARGHIMLDWILAELASSTLNGVLRGPNARTDEGSVIERWKAMSSHFSWIAFGNTPPPPAYAIWGVYFAFAGAAYEVPEVIYRIAVDREGDYLQFDHKRTRRRWRYSDVEWVPIYKTSYMRKDYAVGSYQGGLADPIQTHVWDVTWSEPDPRGKHPTMFSLHPHASPRALQTYFAAFPEPMVEGVTREGKPSYNSSDKVMGCSPYEQVFQDLDTVVALYDIPAGERFPQINGFFSKDLRDVTEDASGWIFARGGNTYLAYRPFAPYRWIPYLHYNSGWAKERHDLGGKLLISEHLRNGTIVQAASVSEYPTFAAFQAAIRALPLEIRLDPRPSVKFTTLRGKSLLLSYGKPPVVNGRKVDYKTWKLFESPYLNAELNSRRLILTHGKLRRVLDAAALTIADDNASQP